MAYPFKKAKTHANQDQGASAMPASLCFTPNIQYRMLAAPGRQQGGQRHALDRYRAELGYIDVVDPGKIYATGCVLPPSSRDCPVGTGRDAAAAAAGTAWGGGNWPGARGCELTAT